MRSILTQRQQWDYLRYAADDSNNTIEAPVDTEDVDNPATEQGSDAFSGDATGTDTPGQLKQPSVMEDAAAVQWRDKGSNPSGTPSGGRGAPAGAAGGAGLGATPSAGGPTPASGDATAWKARIQKDIAPQLQQRGITDPAAQQKAVDSIYQQGITESGWRDIPQQVNDINMVKGTPAQSYLQYVPSTFEHAMDLAGTPGANIHDPDAQIRGVIPLEESEGKFGPGGFSDSSGSGVGYGHGWG